MNTAASCEDVACCRTAADPLGGILVESETAGARFPCFGCDRIAYAADRDSPNIEG